MNKKKVQNLTEKQVEEYLILNPNFLTDNPEVLNSLEVIHETGGAVSLIQKQVEVLRENYNATTNNLLGLLSVAKNNEEIFNETQQLILDLISSENATDIVGKTELTFEKQFHATKCRVFFFKEQDTCPKAGI